MNHLTLLELFGCTLAGIFVLLFILLIPFLIDCFIFFIQKMRDDHQLKWEKEMRNK